MATLDETHTTRARANALRVALSNRGLLDGLDDPALSEVMELCLACKACKSECPTGVDMARLKAEWLYWRNERHGVSSAARFVADAPRMTRRAARFPRIANLLLQNGWVRRALEKRFGLDRRIAPPRFAKRTFRQWFDSTPRSAGKRGRVAYFIDTWTNYYWPEAGVAAVRLLEAAGFEVRAPKLLCCGRPLISQGLLGEAAEVARENVDRLKGVVEAGFFIVGSEPSCILSLLDEYPQLVRTDYAQRLAGRVRCVESLLAEVVREDRSAIPFSSEHVGEPRRVLYHGHCHEKALVGAADALTLLNAPPGLVAEEINSGCCGMAGSFGHEVGHYEIARAVGEQRLFPAVRGRGDAEIAVSGFSCRAQIAQHTGLTPRHVLELAADALSV
jgi:Fe-S oxidoreductase